MKRTFWVYLLLLIFGLIVLAWPEPDATMMIRFSEFHGPSKFDMAGLLIIAMGYAPMMLEVWRTQSVVQQKLGKRNWFVVLASAILCFPGIALALYINNDILLWASVFVSSVLQGVIIYWAFKRSGSSSVN